MGVVTTNDAQRTSITQLLNSIKLESHEPSPGPDTGPASLLLLLTPTYAQRALSGAVSHLVLDPLRIKGANTLTKGLDVTTAVVDRLPSDNDRVSGEEGMAYYFMRNAPSSLSTSRKAFNASTQKPGYITFELPFLPKRLWRYEIQLPLAQTIFSTGKVSTLVHTRYKNEANKGLVIDEQQHLEAQSVVLPFRKTNGAVSTEVPLVPLTPLRVVRNSMGNIIRALSSATAHEEMRDKAIPSEPQTASQELEAAVTAYFRALGIPPEAVNVWALILPVITRSGLNNEGPVSRRLRTLKPEAIPETWTSEAALMDLCMDTLIPRYFRSGGRLHRVLSGGGGWGKKAGLLSLDPDSKYSSRDLRADEGWEFDFDDESDGAVEKQQRQALGEIVTEGESVMFLLAPRETECFTQSRAKTWSYLNSSDLAAVFGAVPSTIDTVPEGRSNDPGSAADRPPHVHHRPNFFGALSEGGLALTITSNPEFENTKHRGRVSSQTKLDVPFSHIRVTEGATDKNQTASINQRPARNEARRERDTSDYWQEAEAVESESPRADDVRAANTVRRVNATAPLEVTRGPHGSDIKLYRGQGRSYSTRARASIPLDNLRVSRTKAESTANLCRILVQRVNFLPPAQSERVSQAMRKSMQAWRDALHALSQARWHDPDRLSRVWLDCNTGLSRALEDDFWPDAADEKTPRISASAQGPSLERQTPRGSTDGRSYNTAHSIAHGDNPVIIRHLTVHTPEVSRRIHQGPKDTRGECKAKYFAQQRRSPLEDRRLSDEHGPMDTVQTLDEPREPREMKARNLRGQTRAIEALTTAGSVPTLPRHLKSTTPGERAKLTGLTRSPSTSATTLNGAPTVSHSVEGSAGSLFTTLQSDSGHLPASAADSRTTGFRDNHPDFAKIRKIDAPSREKTEDMTTAFDQNQRAADNVARSPTMAFGPQSMGSKVRRVDAPRTIPIPAFRRTQSTPGYQRRLDAQVAGTQSREDARRVHEEESRHRERAGSESNEAWEMVSSSLDVGVPGRHTGDAAMGDGRALSGEASKDLAESVRELMGGARG
ncbi:hypothetical protein LTR91_013829 [Friedmanniomyces endolithicus]|uniref:Uncharacterized protein n=1 Tax=Friedmanniomyces endolithicus TaxID=329885 RepID=A0AAN6KCS2_9PEZI|nr:hypothetical protein LTR35_006507 [Friedmanniomyces endolithicus]KAK0909564.1 hypothetical protein LTR57_016274 [Friedmanniomyces endolithicus]KAK0975926.1 hypothetical protein LTR91_013829 [Friedmanniomyces endolithicus]KAK0979241.1 hypothetical protein LTS01_012464 [Friedmanniomyces endolithicus]KAK0981818.1 hypothetical protein LTR54_014883 [Friedmanniomyces endolithicus]